MNKEFENRVSLYECDDYMFHNTSEKDELVKNHGVVKIEYNANIYADHTTYFGSNCVGKPFSEKIPDSLYNYIGYKEWSRDYTYLGNSISRIYLSADRKKVFIDCQDSSEHDYLTKTYLIDVSNGNVLFMEIGMDFYYSRVVEYKNNLYFFMKTEVGFMVFDNNFNDALHSGEYRKVNGDMYSDCYIYNFYKGKYQLFDLEKKLLYKTSFCPCDNRISSEITKRFFEHGLLFIKNSCLYSLVDLSKDEVVAADFYISRRLLKPGDKVYDKNYNILTLDKNVICESSNMNICRFITEGNDIEDLKIYTDENGKIRIAETSDIPIEYEIVRIDDLYQGESLVINGEKNVERNLYMNLVDFSSAYLSKIKVFFENGYFNIYEKGVGWMYNDIDSNDGMI